MRQVSPLLWVGNAGDIRDPRSVFALEIAAVVDLAIDESVPRLPRELVYCRFPLVDAAGNPLWVLTNAIATTAEFLRRGILTLVCCGHGMSRAPAIAAAALAAVGRSSPEQCLDQIARSGPCDVTPGFWRDVCDTWDLLSPALCRS